MAVDQQNRETYSALLSAPVPENWAVKESLTVTAESGEANVIASSEPLHSGIDSQQYAETQGAVLQREFEGYREHSLERAKAFGRGTGWLRRFEWDPQDGERVMQMQLYFAEGGRGFTATATARTSEFARYEKALRYVLDGLHIDADAFRYDPRKTPWPTGA